MLEYKYDTQLLIEGQDLDEDVISDYFTENFKGDCLLAVGDEELIILQTARVYIDASGKVHGWRSAVGLHCKFNRRAV